MGILSGGSGAGMPMDCMILLISLVSLRKATIRISDLHFGHSSGFNSRTRFIQAAQVLDGGVEGSGIGSIESEMRAFSFARLPRNLQE